MKRIATMRITGQPWGRKWKRCREKRKGFMCPRNGRSLLLNDSGFERARLGVGRAILQFPTLGGIAPLHLDDVCYLPSRPSVDDGGSRREYIFSVGRLIP